MGTYRWGIIAVIAFVFLLLTAVAALDTWCHRNDWPSLGYRVQTWSRRNPWLVALLLFGYLALLGHFFAHTAGPPPDSTATSPSFQSTGARPR